MRRAFSVLLAAFGFGLASMTFAAAAPSRPSGPPPSLTQYGQTVWNLEALLHDTFGNRNVWLDYGRGQNAAPNFTTTIPPLYRAGSYTYLFKTARHSTFKTFGPTRPPRVFAVGASQVALPLKIGGAYIYCGANMWLYFLKGNIANWPIMCAKE